MMLSGKSIVHLGGYQIVTLEDGCLSVTRLPSEGWEQLELELAQKAE